MLGELLACCHDRPKTREELTVGLEEVEKWLVRVRCLLTGRKRAEVVVDVALASPPMML